MLRCAELAGRDGDVLQAGRARADCPAEVPARARYARAVDRLGFDVGDADDRGRTRARLGELRRAERRLAHVLRREPVRDRRNGLDEAVARVRHAEPRKRHALVVPARTEGEHVELVERVQRVRGLAGWVEDAVASADLVRVAVLPREPATGEHVEQLLLAAVRMRGRRPAARRELDPAHADADRPGGLAEQRPRALEVSDRARPR